MSTATLKELVEQKEALERLIEERRVSERKKGLDEIRDAMVRHGLTMAEVVKELSLSKGKTATAATAATTAGKRVAVKYLDKATGNQWTGRGLRPKWLRDKIESGGAKIEDFLVN
jgi:DNA-binding protein H-NS